MSQPRKYVSSAARQAAYRTRCQQAQVRQLQQKGLPALPAISTIPGWGRWRAAVHSAQTLLRQVCDEMADYYDARSEDWQEGERGEEFTQRQEALEDLVNQLDTLTL